MRRRFQAAGLALGLAAVPSLAPAQTPFKLTAIYDGVLLVKVLDLSIEQSVTDQAFVAAARMKSYGALSLFKRLDVRAQTRGRLEDGQVRPALFSHANIDGSVNRSVKVRWDTNDVTAQAQPAYRTEGTPAPTRQQKLSATDPLTQVMRIALAPSGDQACRGQARLFDGRQLYAVSLTQPAGRPVTERERALGLTSVVRCKASFAEIAGFDPKPAHKRNQGLKEPMMIDFARVGSSGPWIISALRGSTPLGQAKIEIKSLSITSSSQIASAQ